MSAIIKDSAAIISDSNTAILAGASKATIAFRIFIDNTTPITAADWNGALIFRKDLFTFKCGTVNEDAQSIPVITSLTSGSNVLNNTVQIYAGITYAFFIVFDSTSPSAQVVYVDGVTGTFSKVGTSTLSPTSAPLEIGRAASMAGNLNRIIRVEDFMVWTGYAGTITDAIGHLSGTVDPSNTGVSATHRAWYKLNGNVGSNVASGDAAIANAIDGSWPLSPTVNSAVAGSSLTYGDAIPYASRASFDQPIVFPGGKLVAFPLKAAGIGAALTALSVDGAKLPTFSVDGGPPRSFDRYVGTPNHEAVGCFIDGDPIPKGSVVTFSAQTGFVSTSVGVTPAYSNASCINCAGRPIHQGETPMPGIGLNVTYPFNVYNSYFQGTADMQSRILLDPSSASVSNDGTYAGSGQIYLILPTNTNGFDRTATPLTPGEYAVVYDDLTDSKTKEISLVSLTPDTLEEATEYRNNGANGVGKARVFRTKTTTYDGYSLAQECNPGDTTLTLNTVANLVAQGVSGARMWIKFDDELFSILTVNPTLNQVTVTPGDAGTTAAHHDAGTSGTAGYWAEASPAIYIDFEGPSGPNTYANLAIYGPGDFDLPSPPGPITVDRSIDARRRPSKSIRDAITPGVVTIRHMDALGTFHTAAEVEDVSYDSDMYSRYSYHRTVAFKIQQVRPFAVANSPYTYSHMQGDTWTATLAEAITTTPEAGTIETITISDADSAKIMIGLRIQADDEWMRVVGVDGTSVQVMRGAMNTTPETHVAGFVTVGWRYAIPSDAAVQSTNYVAVEIVTDRPHGVPWAMWAADPNSTDISPLARIPFTLSVAAPSGSTAITISLSDPDDWQYITTNLYLVIGSEAVLVTGAANPDTGIVPVKATTSAHAAGASGVGRSAGFFIATADGTAKMWTLAQTGNIYFYPTGPNTILTKFVCNQLGGKVGICQGTQDWDTTPVMVNGVDQTLISYSLPFSTCSIEHTARVARLAPGSMAWTNIPAHASDDLCYDWAKKLLAALPAGEHTVGLEYMNEIWNIAFAFISMLNGINNFMGNPKYFDWHIIRRQRIYAIFKEVFDAAGRGDEIKSIACFQSGSMSQYLQRCRDLGSIDHVIGAATYIEPYATQANIDLYNASDDWQATDLCSFDLRYCIGGAANRMRIDKAAFEAHKEANPGKTFLFATYEGGLQTALPRPSSGIGDKSIYPAGNARSLDISMHPNYWNTQYDMTYISREIGGYDIVTYFDHCQPPAFQNTGTYGMFALWGITSYNCQPAGKGDGSNGSPNNLDGIAQPGFENSKDPTANYFTNKVSVRLGALNQHATDYAAWLAGGGGDTGGGDTGGGDTGGGDTGGGDTGGGDTGGGDTGGGDTGGGDTGGGDTGGGDTGGGDTGGGDTGGGDTGGGTEQTTIGLSPTQYKRPFPPARFPSRGR